MLTLPSYKNSHPLTTIAHCEKLETSEFATSAVALLLKEKSREFHNMYIFFERINYQEVNNVRVKSFPLGKIPQFK